MAPGLAIKHPDIQTFDGRGIDDPAATIHADSAPSASTPRSGRRRATGTSTPTTTSTRASTRRTTATTAGRTRGHRRLRRARRGERRAVHRQGLLPRRRQRHGQRQRLPADTWLTVTISDPEGIVRRPHAERRRPRTPAPSRRPSSPTRTATSRRTSSRRATGGTTRRRRATRSCAPTTRRRPADRRRAAHVPARADHRPELRRLQRFRERANPAP